MNKFNLAQYTKKVMKELEVENLYPTQLNICYKVIEYYENNYGQVTENKDEFINYIVNKIYEIYIDQDESESLDLLIESIIKEEII